MDSIVIGYIIIHYYIVTINGLYAIRPLTIILNINKLK